MKYTTTILYVPLLILTTTKVSGQDTELKNFFSGAVSSNSKQDLFDDISFGGFDLVSANFKFAKDNNLQKVVISPFKMMNKASILNDSRVNITQKEGISTFGVALGFDNTNPYNTFGNVRKKFSRMPIREAIRERNDSESVAAYGKYLEDMELQGNRDRIKYLQSLAKNAFSVTVGYNISLFEVIGGDKIRNDDSVVVNEYTTKAHAFSADVSYAINENFFFSAGFSHARKRKSAEEKQKMINYNGFNVGVNWRAIRLQKNEKLEHNKDYINSFFIPSIIIGSIFEYQRASGDSTYYQDGIKYQYVITPFLDFKISPKNQFRLGFPIKKFDTVNKNQIALGPFVQYSFILASKE
ncbi:hypothetical protein [[Flexibacter] sp. ATCC 35208]|uniref:hypothetical protein n=1 Tax=[Flexibacter] sp. ATCC 35208 TaxID=1936242 RepID=UPI0009CE556A|nr:hypothetical protein [[Flexibacter] sp. ATCC 35208]OMP80129.1 hypothetical protein BW716_06450 [[Flexibacter] sp. ATCC 35208]